MQQPPRSETPAAKLSEKPAEATPAPGEGPARAESSDKSSVERIGGEERLRVIVDDFVDRVVRDMMIGFLFRHVDIERLKQFEFEFASAHLGGTARYSGRPLGRAHSAHPILGGHFNRRLKILENTLRDFAVPDDIARAWVEHNARLRSQITRDRGDECTLPEEGSTRKQEQR